MVFLPNVDLSFGRHELKVFSEPSFAHLSLRKPSRVQEERTHWLVFHEGRNIPVLKTNSGGESLVQILRDPSHRGNLLAVRKSDLNTLLGETKIYTISKAGEEVEVAKGSLSDYDRNLWVHTVAVRPYTFKKPASQQYSVQALRRKAKWIGQEVERHYERSPFANEKTVKLRQRQSKLLQKIDHLTNGSAFFSVNYYKPRKQKTYAYRKQKLGSLMFAIKEEFARMTGRSEVNASFDRKTSGKFMLKKGWQLVHSFPDRLLCVKDLKGK